MTQVLSVNQDNFTEEALDSPVPVVVDFFAIWCAPCRRLAPTLEKLAEGFENQIKFVKVNTDDNPQLAQQYQITSLPTLVFLDNGQVTSQVAGLIPEEDLRNELESWLESRKTSHP